MFVNIMKAKKQNFINMIVQPPTHEAERFHPGTSRFSGGLSESAYVYTCAELYQTDKILTMSSV